MEVSGQLCAPAALPSAKETRYVPDFQSGTHRPDVAAVANWEIPSLPEIARLIVSHFTNHTGSIIILIIMVEEDHYIQATHRRTPLST
jgi:hypothetical protein